MEGSGVMWWAAIGGFYLVLCLWFVWEIHVAPIEEPDEESFRFHPGDRL